MLRPDIPPLRLRAPNEPRPHRELGPPFNKLVGGWLCLDFVNTVSGRVPAIPGGSHGGDDRALDERLTSYGALLLWSQQAGGLDHSDVSGLADAAARRPREAAAVLARALRLRSALYRMFVARVRSRKVPQEALDVLEEELGRVRRCEHLVEREDGTIEPAWVGDRDELDALLWPVARSAVGLLTSRPRLERLRQCDGERCGWLFVDVSRGGRRRWCDMADCGNVAKVRTHRARKKSHHR